jgi:Ca2+-binding RTX toxin-like protein
VTIALTATKAEIEAKLRELYGIADLKVAIAPPDVGQLTYYVTFTRELAAEPRAVPAIDGSSLLPNLDETVAVETESIRTGTTAPVRTTVQTLTLNGVGTFVLHFVRPDSNGVLQDAHTAAIGFGASAAEVLGAISAALNPNNVNPALPFTDNVQVTRHGNVLHVLLQGEDRFRAIRWVEVSGGTVELATRQSGINYYGVETLNVALGSGDDVLDVQGTSATTNIALGAGDERIYVSSQAAYGLDTGTDYLRGNLDAVRGALNIDAGSGRHLLMISDESALAGDDVEITDAASSAEILIDGLAPAPITFRAAAAGTFADGITIWAGAGDDTIRVDATHLRSGVRTVTTLNTGLGNDVLWVDLQAAQDGFFVLDTQGGHQNALPIAGGLGAGDHHTPADAVQVWIGGVLAAHVANPVTGAVSLLESGWIGAPVDVEVKRTWTEAHVLGTSGEVTFGKAILAAGDVISATMNNAPVAFSRSGNVLTLTGAVAGALVIVTVVRTTTQSFTLPQVAFADDDVVDASSSTLPLIVFGGLGDDTITGGSGADVIFGDRGRVLYLDPAAPLPSAGPPFDAAVLAAWEAAARTVLGHGGSGDKTDGVARGISLAISVDTSLGGNDKIASGGGDDVIIGGAGADEIAGGDGADVVLGDSGRVSAGDREAYALGLAPLPQILGLVTTISPQLGGADRIGGGDGDDILIGGAGTDVLLGGDGDDIVLGDNGALAYDDTRALAGGPESRLRDVRTGDYNDGGRDRLEGGAGEDVLIGGSAGDSIDGDAGDDLIFGDQVALERRDGDVTSLRFQALGGTLLYGPDGQVLLDGIARPYRDSDLTAPSWALFRILGLLHSDAIANAAVPAGKVQTYGDDYIAAGAGDDMVFGQLGNDTLLGDGALEDGPAAARRQPGPGDPLGALILDGSIDRLTDGDDYVEGGGGNDVIFGGLGQDDLIGGSSSLFGLTAPGQRPDGGDYIFGGSGTRIAIDATTGDLADPHSADADAIVGDNGDIVRVVGADGADLGYVSYNHDASGRKVVVRAVTPLDGAGADEIHGESGDDSVYAGAGDDRVFGDADDDDLIGGQGHDWISGGTGTDGILGDDGRVRTHRGGLPEPLFGNPSAPGGLVKTTLQTAPDSGGHDVIFGGLGDDVISGGAGDDAISGAEALRESYAADIVNGALTAIVRTDFTRPYNPGSLLHYGLHAPGQTLPTFALYDEARPASRIFVGGRDFFLTNDPSHGPKLPALPSDGDDRIAGNGGNDWLVGGTGRDVLSGGDGDDLLGADDDLTTDGGANFFQDPDPSYADVLTGGAGRDVFLTNNGADVVVDPDPIPGSGATSPGGNPLPVSGGSVGASSAPAAATPEQLLNPQLDPATRTLDAPVVTPKKKPKKKPFCSKKKNKKKPKCKKKKSKKKKSKTSAKRPQVTGAKGRTER